MNNPHVMNEPDLIEIKNYMYKTFFSQIKNSCFKGFEDIDLDNLRQFLYQALEHYTKQEVSLNAMYNIMDAMETYIHRRYMNEETDVYYPMPSEDDPISIGLNAIDFIKDGINYSNLLPNVMEPLLSYLQTLASQEREATTNMEKFIEEFKIKRLEKAEHHPDGSYTITSDQLQNS